MLLVRLMRIPEIDVPQAVSRMMGRRDLYVQLACRISAERADMVEKLREALRQNNRDAMIEVIHSEVDSGHARRRCAATALHPASAEAWCRRRGA